jgi:uncharacterized protein (TIGR02452 family)
VASRSKRARLARETLEILDRGAYTTPAGREVSVADELAAARSGSRLYRPEQLDDLLRRRDELMRPREGRPPVAFEVVNETTLQAARRLSAGVDPPGVLALNFASARNPGGGFLGGSQAQEESLARSSGLYPCLLACGEMYEVNRRNPSCLYTDHMIYSPGVQVFRDGDGRLLEEPYRVSFLTAPAVNAGAVRHNEPHNVSRIGPTMRARAEKLLAVALAHGHETFVLGAWGCGVFRNDPAEVAGWFAGHLTGEGAFCTAFTRVVFAVLDGSPRGSTIGPFQTLFGRGG